MSNNHTLTPEQWAQIPPEYIWFAADNDGEQWAYTHKPKKISRGGGWLKTYGEALKICDNVYRPVHDWQNSLQKRPTTNEQPETATTPAVTHVRLPMVEFERIAKGFNLNVRHCETYCDAAMYNPAGQIAIVFVSDVPVNVTVHDSVNGIPVTVHDQI